MLPHWLRLRNHWSVFSSSPPCLPLPILAKLTQSSPDPQRPRLLKIHFLKMLIQPNFWLLWRKTVDPRAIIMTLPLYHQSQKFGLHPASHPPSPVLLCLRFTASMILAASTPLFPVLLCLRFTSLILAASTSLFPVLLCLRFTSLILAASTPLFPVLLCLRFTALILETHSRN